MTWVKGPGGVAKWVGPRPEDRIRIVPNSTERQRTHDCPGGCGRRIRPSRKFCRPCHEAVTHMRPMTTPGRPVCGCGCLLAFPGEDCPNCRVQLLKVAA